MKKTISILSACILGVGAIAATFAPDMSVKEFPPMTPSSKDAQKVAKANKFNAPLNVEKFKGPKMFATTISDSERLAQFCSFYSINPQAVTKLGYVYDMTDPNEDYYPPLYSFLGGVMTEDGYYGYKIRAYSFVTHVKNWMRFDMNTGEQEIMASLDVKEIYENWEYIYDLTYNWNTKKIYGLARNEDGTTSSMIGEIDKETGEFTKKVMACKDYYMAIAATMDNEIYALRWVYDKKSVIIGTAIDVLDDKFNIVRTIDVTVDGKPYLSYYQHGLDFDHTTGDLWWLATDTSANQILVKINPETGEGKSYGRFGYLEAAIGLAIPFTTADSRTSPAQVQDLAFLPSEDGSQVATLTWTNPTTQWNRQPLTSLNKVSIYRDDMKSAPVAELDATDKIGETMSWTDKTATRGIHKYYVCASNETGKNGVPDTIHAFVGRDVIGPVENLKAETFDGKSVTLTWDVPTRGDNDGWFSKQNISYRVTRMPGNKVFDDVITDTRFEDKDIPEAQYYSYTVTAYNEDGKGGESVSNSLIAGNALVAPITLDFNNRQDADRFTSLDINGDGITFEYSFDTNTGGNALKLMSMGALNDDILVSPTLHMTKGKTYRVDYNISVGGYGEYDRIMHHVYELLGGVGTTAADLTTVLAEVPDLMTDRLYQYKVLTHYFVAPEDGDYNIGLHWFTPDEDNMWLYVEGFHFEEVGDKDLSVTELSTHLALTNNDASYNIYNVEIYNNGLKDQKDYKVQIGYNAYGRFNVFAEAEDADKPEIKSRESQVIALIGNPDFVEPTAIQARVVLEGDINDFNDFSEPVTVSVVSGAGLNYTVTEERSEERTTHIPVCHYTQHGMTQTIYTPDMIDLKTKDNTNVTIYAIAWDYIADAAASGSDIKVYLSQTDKEGYSSDSPTWEPIPSTPVYEGKYEIVQGNNYLYIPLATPFEFDPTKSLVVSVANHDDLNSGKFLMQFLCFDGSWYNPLFHSIKYRGAAPFSTANAANNTSVNPEAPTLHLAVAGDFIQSGQGSVEGVSADASVRFNGMTNIVSSANGIKEVKVYDYTGALCGVYTNSAWSNTLHIGAAKGFYILDITENNGNKVSMKVSVK